LCRRRSGSNKFTIETGFLPVWNELDGLWWLLLLVGPLLFLQRRLHREIQAVFLLLTKRPEISLALFSVLFFPGVLLHETSHWLAAHLLAVRTGRFSLLPRPLKDGRLQPGFVETSVTDPVRAPLLARRRCWLAGLSWRMPGGFTWVYRFSG
jgi:hypothetical protein